MSWRKIHFWLGLVVVVQMFLWIVSGIGFALLPDDELQGRVDSRQMPAPPLAAEAATLSNEDGFIGPGRWAVDGVRFRY